eukprot:scaffold10124_cov149-Skeletonema_menzelii.AAC.8
MTRTESPIADDPIVNPSARKFSENCKSNDQLSIKLMPCADSDSSTNNQQQHVLESRLPQLRTGDMARLWDACEEDRCPNWRKGIYTPCKGKDNSTTDAPPTNETK